jgi:hypothetical protein
VSDVWAGTLNSTLFLSRPLPSQFKACRQNHSHSTLKSISDAIMSSASPSPLTSLTDSEIWDAIRKMVVYYDKICAGVEGAEQLQAKNEAFVCLSSFPFPSFYANSLTFPVYSLLTSGTRLSSPDRCATIAYQMCSTARPLSTRTWTWTIWNG